jgi:hypothetical protein
MTLKVSLFKERYENEINMLKNIFGLFMVDHKELDKNIWMLAQRSKGGLDANYIESLPFWRYEQYVSIVNDLAEEEKREREKQEAEQKKSNPASSYNPSSYLNKMSSMANKFKR